MRIRDEGLGGATLSDCGRWCVMKAHSSERARCGAGPGCSAIRYQTIGSMGEHVQRCEVTGFAVGPGLERFLALRRREVPQERPRELLAQILSQDNWS